MPIAFIVLIPITSPFRLSSGPDGRGDTQHVVREHGAPIHQMASQWLVQPARRLDHGTPRPPPELPELMAASVWMYSI